MTIRGYTPRTNLPIYDDFRNCPWDAQRWPNFSPEELKCRGTGRVAYHPETMDLLQALRTELGRPMMINSAYRSPEHNANVGGARRSWHMDAVAFDVSMENHDPHQYERAGRAVGLNSVGRYPHLNFIHLDSRTMFGYQAWDGGPEFSNNAAPFQSPEPVERPAVSGREASGAGAGALIGAGGVALAPTAIREVSPTLEAVQGLAPMAQTALVGGAILLVGTGIVFGPRLLRELRSRRQGERDL